MDYLFQLQHIGINESNEEEARRVTAFLHAVFGFPLRETSSAIFANEQIEIMKSPGRGRLGHFAVGTSDVAKAQLFLESQGISFDESSASYNVAGEKIVIYAREELSGFAWHLIKRPETP